MACFRVVMFSLIAVLAVDVRATDLQVLFFTMQGCPPCHQTEPNIDRLQQSGIAVAKIDVRQHADYAASCGVVQTPTILVVRDQRVLARHTGAMTWTALRELVDGHRQPPSEPAVVQSTANESPASTVAPEAGKQPLSPQQRAWQACVRLRIEDAEGTSYATGTIVHRIDNEALVLTCGHVFRDSDGSGVIHADLGFHQGEPATVTGTLVAWDADKHDVALVAVPCPFPIEPVAIARGSLPIEVGQSLFSFGCDRGAPPSMRPTTLKAVTRYSGIAKYDIVGRPVDGRSGGGLFTTDGYLVGVCNAAAVEVDEGIYTGLESIYWQLASCNLEHLFRDTDAGTQAIAASEPPARPVAHEAAPMPTTPVADAGSAMPGIRRAALPVATENSDLEVIVLVRAANDPQKTEAITLRNPDPALLEWIERARHEQSAAEREYPRFADRSNGLPELRPAASRDEPLVRAQSPR